MKRKLGILIAMFSMSLVLCSCGKQINYEELFTEEKPLEAIRSAYGYRKSTENLANKPEFIAASKNYIDKIVSERDWDALEEYTDTLKNDWDVYPNEIRDAVKQKMDELKTEANLTGYDPENEEGYYSSKEDEITQETDSDGYKHNIGTYYYGDLFVKVDYWWNPLSLYDNLNGKLTSLYYKDMKLQPNPYGESKKEKHFPSYNDNSLDDIDLNNFYFSEDYIIFEKEDSWIVYNLTEEGSSFLNGVEIFGQ